MVKYETELCDLVYPVGSIYMSVNSTNPKYLFGGEWEQIKDTFLLACGNDYNNGQTGGESTHTLTVDEMPSHTHTQNSHSHKPNSTSLKFMTTQDNIAVNGTARAWTSQSSSGTHYVYSSDTNGINEDATTQSVTATNQNEGGDQEHNNMPPYLAVYVWKRKS